MTSRQLPKATQRRRVLQNSMWTALMRSRSGVSWMQATTWHLDISGSVLRSCLKISLFLSPPWKPYWMVSSSHLLCLTRRICSSLAFKFPIFPQSDILENLPAIKQYSQQYVHPGARQDLKHTFPSLPEACCTELLEQDASGNPPSSGGASSSREDSSSEDPGQSGSEEVSEIEDDSEEEDIDATKGSAYCSLSICGLTSCLPRRLINGPH